MERFMISKKLSVSFLRYTVKGRSIYERKTIAQYAMDNRRNQQIIKQIIKEFMKISTKQAKSSLRSLKYRFQVELRSFNTLTGGLYSEIRKTTKNIW